MRPTNFDLIESAGSTKISIVGNNQTYTLSGVPLSQMSINNIAALDSGTVAKWQSAIASSGVAATAASTPL
jgi:chitinase